MEYGPGEGREETTAYEDSHPQREAEDDYSEEEEGDDEVKVCEGEIYSSPGVCQDTVKEMILARGSSLLAREVYKVPDMTAGKRN